jgi:hypothetical protein
MAQFLFQAYNITMTKLIEQHQKKFDCTIDALVEAYNMADIYDIVVLMEQSIIDNKCWKKIAKFY